MKNEEVFLRVKEERKILNATKRRKDRTEWREDEEEDVRSYWMTFTKREDMRNRRRKD